MTSDHLLRARGRLRVIGSLLDDAQAFNREGKRTRSSLVKQAADSAMWLLRDLLAASAEEDEKA